MASLAAIAKVIITSRPGGEETPWPSKWLGWDPRPFRGSSGTVVKAHDLFHSVPARRQFLKTVRTEAGHVTVAVRHDAMACPEVEFELRHNGRRMLRARAREDRIQDLFSKTVAESSGLDPFQWTVEGCRRGGFRAADRLPTRLPGVFQEPGPP